MIRISMSECLDLEDHQRPGEYSQQGSAGGQMATNRDQCEEAATCKRPILRHDCFQVDHDELTVTPACDLPMKIQIFPDPLPLCSADQVSNCRLFSKQSQSQSNTPFVRLQDQQQSQVTITRLRTPISKVHPHQRLTLTLTPRPEQPPSVQGPHGRIVLGLVFPTDPVPFWQCYNMLWPG